MQRCEPHQRVRPTARGEERARGGVAARRHRARTRCCAATSAWSAFPASCSRPRRGWGCPPSRSGTTGCSPSARYAGLLRHLASWGIVVAAPDSQRGPLPSHARFAADLRTALEVCVGVRLGDGPISVDGRRTALAGHGIGGGAALLAAADSPAVRGGGHHRGRPDPALRARRRPPRDRADAAHRRRHATRSRRPPGTPSRSPRPRAGRCGCAPCARPSTPASSTARTGATSLLTGGPSAKTRKLTRALVTAFLLHHLAGRGPRRRAGGRQGQGHRARHPPLSSDRPRTAPASSSLTLSRRPGRRAAGCGRRARRPRGGGRAAEPRAVRRSDRPVRPLARPPCRQAHRRVGVTLEAGPQRQQPLAPFPAVVIRPPCGEPPREVADLPGDGRRARPRDRPTSSGPAPARAAPGTSPVRAGQRPQRRATPPPPARPRPSRERRPAPPARGPPARRRRPGGRARRPAPRLPGSADERGQVHGIQCGRPQRGAQRLDRLRAARSAATSTCSSGGTASMVHHRPRPRAVREKPVRRLARCGDDRAQLVGDPAGLLDRRGLDHHPHQLLGARRPQQHPAGVAEARLGGGHGLLDGRATRRRRPCPPPGRSPVPAAGRSRRRRGRRGSCRSGPCGPSGAAPSAARRPWWRSAGSTTCPDCSPPSANPPARSSSSTYRSPTWVVRSVMPRSRIARCRPRLLMTVATSVSSTSSPASCIARASTAMIWSPSTSRPSASTARQRSASPSWAMPRSAPCARTAARSGAEVGRAHAVVDVEPVRVGVQRDDLRAGAGVAVGRDRRRRAVGAVDDHPQPGQRLRGARQQVRDVPRPGVRHVAHAADRRTGRTGERRAEALPRRRARRRRAACARPPRRA